MNDNPAHTPRSNWTREQVTALFNLPFNDLFYQAQTVHRANFDNTAIFWQNTHKGQYVAFLSIKKASKLKARKFARKNVKTSKTKSGKKLQLL